MELLDCINWWNMAREFARPEYFWFHASAALLLLLFLNPKAVWAQRAGLIVSSLLTLRFLYWRATSTLALESVPSAVCSVLLLAADIYGAVSMAFFYVHLWNRHKSGPQPRGLPGFPPVDVFITIYDEPTEILYRTAVGCQALDYPDKTVHILDDGGRPEVKKIAEELGCVYIARSDRSGAKAGNINHALKHTRGEFIAFFDVDHIPVRSFLRETIGYFGDPKVAAVQTPHYSTNDDHFQRNLVLGREVANEQDLFYRVIMHGLSFWNASFFSGSAGVMRRNALEEVGGFVTDTVTEDTHTSMQLHARGHRIIYLNKDLVHGLAPENLSRFIIQRVRWATGSFQILMKDNPLLKKGFTPAQRLFYANILTYYLFPLQKMIYLAAPAMYIFFGWRCMEADIPSLASYFLPMFVINMIVFDTICGDVAHFALSTIYEIVLLFPILGKIIETFLLRHVTGFKFQVTPKGGASHVRQYNWGSAAPIAALLIMQFACVMAASSRWYSDPPGWRFLLINFVWAVYNFIFCSLALGCTQDQPYRRVSPRVKLAVPCRIAAGHKELGAVTVDISEGGCLLGIPGRATLPDRFELLLMDAPVSGSLRARVVHLHYTGRGDTLAKVNFEDMSPAQRQGVIRLAYTLPESLSFVRDDAYTPKPGALKPQVAQ